MNYNLLFNKHTSIMS
uniref:Uncharacterized protein n=1 Tax=Anguilla anguilla TaxID=7936 RepID=A0A0E9RNQ5_ANGAN